MNWLAEVHFGEDGLVPVIAQDTGSGRVLMVAWANREALAETARTKHAVYWSRSRDRIWRKGEESGHTQLVRVDGIGEYRMLGESLDDAAGEAFDKVAKMLGLPYPGGPHIARMAERGDAGRFDFPRPMVNRPGLDFSFSGLKTYTLNTIAGIRRDGADLAVSEQLAHLGLAGEPEAAVQLLLDLVEVQLARGRQDGEQVAALGFRCVSETKRKIGRERQRQLE